MKISTVFSQNYTNTNVHKIAPPSQKKIDKYGITLYTLFEPQIKRLRGHGHTGVGFTQCSHRLTNKGVCSIHAYCRGVLDVSLNL
jgi:hypothetical protein